MTQTQQAEIDRRYAAIREAARAHDVDAVVVSGSEYTGFEGAVRYLSGFRILHRYAYVVLPVEGEPAIVYPREARWVGDHGEAWIEEQVFAEHPGRWIASRAADEGWRRLGDAAVGEAGERSDRVRGGVEDQLAPLRAACVLERVRGHPPARARVGERLDLVHRRRARLERADVGIALRVPADVAGLDDVAGREGRAADHLANVLRDQLLVPGAVLD